MFLTAAKAIFLPVGTDPVNDIASTFEADNAAPTSPAPCTILNTPLGKCLSSTSANKCAVAGVNSEGFNTTVFP